MRTYGRVLANPLYPDGPLVWKVVETDAQGYNDYVYVTALAQTLKLNVGESPFYADSGIPAKTSVMQQVFPDYYVTLTQQYYTQFFAALIVAKRNEPEPVYDISVTTHQGFKINATVPVPT